MPLLKINFIYLESILKLTERTHGSFSFKFAVWVFLRWTQILSLGLSFWFFISAGSLSLADNPLPAPQWIPIPVRAELAPLAQRWNLGLEVEFRTPDAIAKGLLPFFDWKALENRMKNERASFGRVARSFRSDQRVAPPWNSKWAQGIKTLEVLNRYWLPRLAKHWNSGDPSSFPLLRGWQRFLQTQFVPQLLTGAIPVEWLCLRSDLAPPWKAFWQRIELTRVWAPTTFHRFNLEWRHLTPPQHDLLVSWQDGIRWARLMGVERPLEASARLNHEVNEALSGRMGVQLNLSPKNPDGDLSKENRREQHSWLERAANLYRFKTVLTLLEAHRFPEHPLDLVKQKGTLGSPAYRWELCRRVAGFTNTLLIWDNLATTAKLWSDTTSTTFPTTIQAVLMKTILGQRVDAWVRSPGWRRQVSSILSLDRWTRQVFWAWFSLGRELGIPMVQLERKLISPRRWDHMVLIELLRNLDLPWSPRTLNQMIQAAGTDKEMPDALLINISGRHLIRNLRRNLSPSNIGNLGLSVLDWLNDPQISFTYGLAYFDPILRMILHMDEFHDSLTDVESALRPAFVFLLQKTYEAIHEEQFGQLEHYLWLQCLALWTNMPGFFQDRELFNLLYRTEDALIELHKKSLEKNPPLYDGIESYLTDFFTFFCGQVALPKDLMGRIQSLALRLFKHLVQKNPRDYLSINDGLTLNHNFLGLVILSIEWPLAQRILFRLALDIGSSDQEFLAREALTTHAALLNPEDCRLFLRRVLRRLSFEQAQDLIPMVQAFLEAKKISATEAEFFRESLNRHPHPWIRRLSTQEGLQPQSCNQVLEANRQATGT